MTICNQPIINTPVPDPLKYDMRCMDTAAKAHSFVILSVLPTLGRTFRPVRRKNSAAAEEKQAGPLVIFCNLLLMPLGIISRPWSFAKLNIINVKIIE
jgi:hypothetical protein